MAIFIISDATMRLRDAGYIQTKLNAALSSLGKSVSSGASYQADIDVDTLWIDPTLNLTKANLKAMGMKKFGNGVSHAPASSFWWFVIPESDYSTILANIGSIQNLS